MCRLFRAWPGCLLGALLCGFVVGAASSIALLASWHEIVERIAAASINLNQVIGFGGLAALAPVASGFVAE